MINNITLCGRTTTAPELRNTPLGDFYTTFTLAVDENKNKTNFIPCVAFGKLAQLICQNDKGALIGVSGRLTQKTFTRTDGTKGSSLEVIVNDFSFLEKRKDEEPKTEESQDFPVPDNDLPF